MIEWFGFGSRRPKNMWIRIRIWIRNTGENKLIVSGLNRTGVPTRQHRNLRRTLWTKRQLASLKSDYSEPLQHNLQYLFYVLDFQIRNPGLTFSSTNSLWACRMRLWPVPNPELGSFSLGTALYSGVWLSSSAGRRGWAWRQGCGSGSAWIRINLSCWIRIRIQKGKNDPQKKDKVKKFHVLNWRFLL